MRAHLALMLVATVSSFLRACLNSRNQQQYFYVGFASPQLAQRRSAVAERFLRIRFSRNLRFLLLSTESYYMRRLRLGNHRSVQNAFSNMKEKTYLLVGSRSCESLVCFVRIGH
jgi:hypothetical protein